HGGGMVLGADEVPIIAKRGERVLTQEQQQGWGGGIQVNIINQTDSKVTAREGTSAGGMPKLDVLVEVVESAMADNVSLGRGPMYGAMASTFGVSQVARSGG